MQAIENILPIPDASTRALPRELRDFRDYHSGETLLVCGCGSSLPTVVSPGRFITIGVNDVGRLFQPDYLVVLNPRHQFSGDRFRYVEESRAKAIFTQLSLGLRHPHVVPIRLGRRGGIDFGDSSILHYTRNSPYLAVCLAMHMGAARIGVIGVDFTDNHFFAATGRHSLSGEFEQIDREYHRLADACARQGIEILNLSSLSRLTAFPKIAPEQFAAATFVDPLLASSVRGRRVFFVHYRFLSCGEVFRDGLERAADDLGVHQAGAYWDDPSLHAKVEQFSPDLLFVVHGRKFHQRWGSRFAHRNSAVWLVDEPYEVDDTSRFSAEFGTVFVNDPATMHRHPNAHYLPVCYDPHACAYLPGEIRPHRVGFVGGANPARERLLNALAQRDLLSYVVGGPWNMPTLRHLTLASNIPADRTAALYRETGIILNIFRTAHHFNRDRVQPFSLNPRVYEAAGCGALVVSEPRPELARLWCDAPVFDGEYQLVSTLERLLQDVTAADELRRSCIKSFRKHTYAARLSAALAAALDLRVPAPFVRAVPSEPSVPIIGSMPPPASLTTAPGVLQPPAGWVTIGAGVATGPESSVTLTADALDETGLASEQPFAAVRLSFEMRLDERCRFIAKLHHAVRGEPVADSYHLLATPQLSYVARHHVILAPITLARDAWQRVEMTWNGGALTVAIDGREACCCSDALLAAGYCFIGVIDGSAALRALRIESPPPGDARPVAAGWSVQGTGTLSGYGNDVILSAEPGGAVSLVSETSANDVELAFSVRLDAGAHFIAKIHHQTVDDPDANSYHLISTPEHGYLARHHRVLANVRLERCAWQQVLLRWVDQRLSLLVNGRRCAGVGDNLLQSGYCVVGVTAGSAELRGLTVRDMSASKERGVPGIAAATPQPGRDPMPFTTIPRRNLIYHVWPVRGDMWRWNVEQLRSRIDIFNGRRIIGIVHDERSEDPDEVRKAFAGHGCEFVVARNGPPGEGLTFPSMLAQVRSLDPNEVTFYAHAKGVKYEPSIPGPVRRWAETQYRTGLDHWPSVRSQLERFAMTGSFKILGRFRVHHYAGDWHYSGTFFWLRHAFVFAREVGNLQTFYGCVEAWPGMHFQREETGCLFMDSLRQLPYHEEFWKAFGDKAFAHWETTHPAPRPPADLVTPPAFEGWTTPRLEQQPEEFAWLLDELASISPRHVLTIGSMHGGVEWHVARRFRALDRDVHITAVDIVALPELLATLDDARHRFSQSIELVIGDSTAIATRARLAQQYDVVFIDGDHSYRGTRADVEFALSRSPRLIALHDISDSDWHAQARCSVSRVWEELRKRYSTENRVVGDWGGIGIVRL